MVFKNRKNFMILVTNDDGILALGIKALIEVASSFDEVLVVAPDSPQSGKGHAITILDPLRLRKVEMMSGVTAYECNGTPADCVKLAKNILDKDKKIKLCVSGINHGSNASINILYSGTMSAAMEASLEGTPSIGFSLLDYRFDADFSAAKIVVSQILGQMLSHVYPNTTLLNVNIPALPLEQIQGIKICRQARGIWVEDYKVGIDPRGETYYWLSGKFESQDNSEDLINDVAALAHGYVTVVPSHHDLTHYESIKSLSYLENQILL
jgi:5'-nucleotidase